MKKFFTLLLGFYPATLFADTPPILVEMFTSFNCPACPAADHYAKGMVEKNKALVLSYHVDYWNTKDFTDPFSHFNFTQRQYDYSNVVGERPGKVFTPQMVVNGAQAIKPPFAAKVPLALKSPKHSITQSIDFARLGDEIKLNFPRIGGFDFPVLWVVGYNNTKKITLTEGSHKGRKAIAVNTVMYLAELPYTGESSITLGKHQIPRTENLAVFLQGAGPGNILALGTLAL